MAIYRWHEYRYRGDVPTEIAAVFPFAAEINAALRLTGWRIMEVTINMTTGFARVVAERRAEGKGVKVTLLRSVHGAKVVERRDLIERKDGMYRDFWAVTEASFGGRRFDGMRSALRGLAHYIDDNADAGNRVAGTVLRPLAATFTD